MLDCAACLHQAASRSSWGAAACSPAVGGTSLRPWPRASSRRTSPPQEEEEGAQLLEAGAPALGLPASDLRSTSPPSPAEEGKEMGTPTATLLLPPLQIEVGLPRATRRRPQARALPLAAGSSAWQHGGTRH
jgi:hypothetical protein